MKYKVQNLYKIPWQKFFDLQLAALLHSCLIISPVSELPKENILLFSIATLSRIENISVISNKRQNNRMMNIGHYKESTPGGYKYEVTKQHSDECREPPAI